MKNYFKVDEDKLPAAQKRKKKTINPHYFPKPFVTLICRRKANESQRLIGLVDTVMESDVEAIYDTGARRYV
jgi:hypothetical protein